MEPILPTTTPPEATTAQASQSAFEMARSDAGVVIWECVAGWLRVVVLGPAPTGEGPGTRFLERARGVIREQLHAVVPQHDPFAECARLMRAVDEVMREQLPAESEERATMVVAVAHQGLAWVGHTGDGAACLLRNGQLTWLLESLPDSRQTRARRDRREARHLLRPSSSSIVVPWIGMRPNADREPLLVRVRPREVRLVPGDRLLLSSMPARDLQNFRPLTTLLGAPRPDDAAQRLGSALAVQRAAPHLAVALLAWGPTDHRSDDGVTDLDEQLSGELVQGLTDLIRDITDEFDLGATPAYDERVRSPGGEAAGYVFSHGGADDTADPPDRAVDAAHVRAQRPPGEDLDAVEQAFGPQASLGVPSQPTLEPDPVPQARPQAPPPPRSPTIRLARWLGLFALGFGLTLLAFVLALTLATS